MPCNNEVIVAGINHNYNCHINSSDVTASVSPSQLYGPTNITCTWGNGDVSYDVMLVLTVDPSTQATGIIAQFRDNGEHGPFYTDVQNRKV